MPCGGQVDRQVDYLDALIDSASGAESTLSRVQSSWAEGEGITKSPAIHCELNQ